MIRNASALVQPSDALRRHMKTMYPERGAPVSGSPLGVMDDLVKVDALAGALTDALTACQTADGRLDPTDVAAFILKRMLNGIALTGSAITDFAAAETFGRLLTRAIEATQGADGVVDTRNVAVYVLRAMKRNQ